MSSENKTLSLNNLPSFNFSAYEKVMAQGQPITPFHGLGLEAEQAFNPDVASLQDLAHSLVDKGLLKAEQLTPVELRVISSVSETPEELRLAEEELKLAQAETNALSKAEAQFGELYQNLTSYFYTDGEERLDLITLNTGEILEIINLHDDPTISVQNSFLHELGHATVDNESLMAKAEETLQLNNSFDSIEDVSRLLSATAPSCENKELSATLREMYADSFQGMSRLALEGPEGAVATIDRLLEVRHNELTLMLASSALGEDRVPETFVSNHHTSEALLLLREGVINGEAQAALESGNGQDYALGIAAQGYFQEYESTRFADMNVHHLDGDSLKPGTPEGVTKEDLLRADALGNLGSSQCTGNTGMTVLVDKAIYSALTSDGIDVGGTGVVSKNSFDSNFEILSLESTTLNFYEDFVDKPLMTMEGQSSLEAYLVAHQDQLIEFKEFGTRASAADAFGVEPYAAPPAIEVINLSQRAEPDSSQSEQEDSMEM